VAEHPRTGAEAEVPVAGDAMIGRSPTHRRDGTRWDGPESEVREEEGLRVGAVSACAQPETWSRGTATTSSSVVAPVRAGRLRRVERADLRRRNGRDEQATGTDYGVCRRPSRRPRRYRRTTPARCRPVGSGAVALSSRAFGRGSCGSAEASTCARFRLASDCAAAGPGKALATPFCGV